METEKIITNSKLIGKFYELLNYDGSVMDKMKINFVTEITESSIKHEDGSFSPSFTYTLVSEKGGGWYRYNNNAYDRIVDK